MWKHLIILNYIKLVKHILSGIPVISPSFYHLSSLALCSPLPARSYKTMEYVFPQKMWKNVKQKSNQKKTNQNAKKNKKKQKKCKKKTKKQKKTRAQAKGTHKKQNFKSQSVFGCKSKYLTSCKQIFKLPAASKKNMEQKLIPSILTMIMMWLKIKGLNLEWPPH